MSDNIAMQTRCPMCGNETYALNVYDFSLGNSACHVCGQKSRPMSDDEYRRVMRERVQATPPTSGYVGSSDPA